MKAIVSAYLPVELAKELDVLSEQLSVPRSKILERLVASGLRCAPSRKQEEALRALEDFLLEELDDGGRANALLYLARVRSSISRVVFEE